MKKTVSIIMALVMLMALVPMSAFATELENNEVLVSVPAGFPENAADRVIASFEEDGAAIGRIESGANTYNPNNKANVYSDGDGTTLESAFVDGALKLEYTGITAGQFANINVYTDTQQNQNITADTTMLVFHMDTTGVAAQGEEGEAGSVAIRLTLSESNGNSGASTKAYLLDSEKYYFQADGTEELVEKATRGASSIWNCYLDAEVGVSGTYYIPVDAFILDENNQATEGACDQAAWDAFVAGCATSWKHNSAINFQFRDYEMVVGDAIVVDDFRWAIDYPIDYAYKAIFNDYTYFRPNFNWTWTYGNCSGYSNDPDGAVTKDELANINGTFAVTPNATAKDNTRFTITIDEIGHKWDETFEAFAFDLDISELTEDKRIRMKFVARNSVVEGEVETLTEDSFAVAANGATIYFLGEDGSASPVVLNGDMYAQLLIPAGFKGTVVIPKEAVMVAGKFDTTGFNLHDEFTEFGFQFEILSWMASENGASIYVDNFGYYSNEEIYAVPHACTYDHACSSFCNVCGKPNTAEHSYDNAVDASCNVCHETREITYTGWIQIGDKWAFYTNGVQKVNGWASDSQGWCYLGEDGFAVTNTWKRDSYGWCWLNENGSQAKDVWVEDGGKLYYVNAEGYMESSVWKYDGNGWIYLGSNGAMATNAWVRDSQGWCYVGEDGYCVSNVWKKDSKGWVYLGSDYRMVTNSWVKDSQGWCFVGADGYAVTNTWKSDSNGWCYLGEQGSQVKNNWVWDGAWYFIDAEGYMVSNVTLNIKGVDYTFAANGKLVG